MRPALFCLATVGLMLMPLEALAVQLRLALENVAHYNFAINPGTDPLAIEMSFISDDLLNPPDTTISVGFMLQDDANLIQETVTLTKNLATYTLTRDGIPVHDEIPVASTTNVTLGAYNWPIIAESFVQPLNHWLTVFDKTFELSFWEHVNVGQMGWTKFNYTLDTFELEKITLHHAQKNTPPFHRAYYSVAFWGTIRVVPEPSTLALSLIALGALVGRRERGSRCG